MSNLNIIDENGAIIGVDSRDNIHAKGLLHKTVHVWFFTPKGEIIFQHRGKNAETFPDLLDATVGGHVEIGQDYEETALKEMKEETGVEVKREDLIPIQVVNIKNSDPITGKIENSLRSIFAYCFQGNLTDLKLEPGQGIGFEAWFFERIFKISEEDSKKFIPGILKKTNIDIFRKIQTMISKISNK
ncbi:MAG: NUDIX domain-containing protein [Candidatus Magasanikbacteria bacterium]|nr:NUDIX domain-containing protein [Candidatus Magasanikbacteria bacterium]